MDKQGFNRFFITAVIFWILALASVPLLHTMETVPSGWDTQVYVSAIHSLQAGHDPYADGIAVQRARHAYMLQHPDAMPPYTYVYSPLTLPLVRAVSHVPLRVLAGLYWVVYIVAIIVLSCTPLFAAERWERNTFLLLAPAAPFFPGLLQTNVFFSGNIAYILYAAVFATAILGWKRGQWTWFYLVTFFASCCKAPLLSLLLIPVFSYRRQWLPASITAAAGLAAFAVQPLLWPSLMKNYLEAVALQFSYNHDFGFSPAGMLGNLLFYLHREYSITSTIFYGAYALCIFGVMIHLTRRYFAGAFTLQQWIPVLLIGVFLLNPRLKEYDVAALSLPMAFIAWRLFAHKNTYGRTVLTMALFFAAVNAIATHYSSEVWRAFDGLLLVGIFIAGVWQLLCAQPPTAMQTEVRD